MKKLTTLVLVAGLWLILAASTHNPGTYIGVGGAGSFYTPSMAVPATVAVAVSRELNIWFDQLSPPQNGAPGAGYVFATTAGAMQDSSYRYTPSVATTTALVITAVDGSGAALDAETVSLVATSKTAGTGNKKILFIGDSVLAGNQNKVVAEVDTVFNLDTPTGATASFLGTQGWTGYKHEAYAGAAWVDFTTAGKTVGITNPFWRTSRNDFRDYLNDTSQTGPIDYAVIYLGYNDLFNGGATLCDPDTIMTRIDSFCTGLLDGTYGYPDCKIILCLPSYPAAALSAYGDDYNDGDPPNQLWSYFLRNLAAYHQAIVDRYDAGAWNANVSVCATNLWVDRSHGFAGEATTRSARSSAATWKHNNYLHPNDSGKQQLADAIYSHLRYLRSFEPAATNLLVNSNHFAAAASPQGWAATGSPTGPVAISDHLGGTAAEQWTTAGGVATYFQATYALNAITLAAQNVFSVWLRNMGTTPNARLALNVATGTNVSIDVNINADTASLAWTFNGASLPAGYSWGYVDEAAGWVRVWFQVPADAGRNNDVGDQVTPVIYIERSTGTTRAVGMYGAQYETGVTTPSALDINP